ncbi:MAG: hypothetical protein PF517_19580 [Salinivirgaceae bacterium]|jgi:uncharacterized membrane protein YidH (DUF202 family)|nr:hypothetical protein [Salinivirgaceae bacterium]
MDNKVIIGIGILIFTYGLFSWALGRYINKKKEKKFSEFQNFLAGAWIIGLIIVFIILILYLG